MTQNSGVFTGGQDAQFKYRFANTLPSYCKRILCSCVKLKMYTKQKGFITADIEFINYKASSFTTDPEWR